jgi:hypothetical protein
MILLLVEVSENALYWQLNPILDSFIIALFSVSSPLIVVCSGACYVACYVACLFRSFCRCLFSSDDFIPPLIEIELS